MTTRSEWEALAARCEAATGPDREIDCLIAVAADDVPAGYERVDAFTWVFRQRGLMPMTYSPATFTWSLDAIVALIELELPGRGWIIANPGSDELNCRADILDGGPTVYAASPTLALCLAFCRAKAALAEDASDA